MVRVLVPFLVLLAILLCLPGAAFAGPDSVVRRPPPEQVASWIVGGDPGEVDLAINTLHGAPKAYLAAVIRCVHAKRASTSPLPHADDPTTVLLEARVYSGRLGLAKRLLGEGRMRGSHLLDASETDAIGEALQGQEGAKVLHAPSLVIADGQWGTVKVTTPFSYLKSFRVDEQGSDTIKSPVLDIVEEGLVFEVRPKLSEDGSRITLAGALTQTAVERPVATQQVDGDEVQVPIVQTSRFDLHLTAPDGATVANAGLLHPTDAERELLVLLHVRRVTPLEPFTPKEPPAGTRLVTMEVRLLRATSDALERALEQRLPHAESPLLGLDAEDVVRLLGPGRKGARGVEILSAPRLTTYDGQHANVSVLNQTSYVKDFEIERSEDGAVILDPVIGTLQDGLIFEATPTITADRTRIGFETKTTWAVLTRPIPEFTTTIEGQEVTIQIPELRVSRVRKEFDLQAGAYVLIGGFDEDPDGRRTCVLLHASVTDLDAEEAKLLGEGVDLTPR